MMNEKDLQLQAPSAKKIASATIAAVVVAVVVLVVAVLPAEYGIDPLGTGHALGLVDLAAANAANAATPAPAPAQAPAPEQAAPPQTAGLKQGEIKTPPAVDGWNKGHTGLYKTDSREIKLDPKQGMEFKYRMEKGAAMVYVWQSTAKVRYEFHGEPEGSAKGTYESYAIDEGDGVERGNGSFVAPFTGIHGWYWQNITDSPVVVQLTSSGFYSQGKEFRKNANATHSLPDVKIEKGK